ncbi:hypothetical protein [Paracoccus sulfuroxidans]|uniref:Uncharacterized protein n=1 Tax=Paracoccus sulfuroxidans TaxID=384678 RepID=A0A562P2Y2_9RHOB|nr:hypothetical protein [Paracoccus sulfuroxidans]TWI29375.1 hypothetical protein IQ24_03581 [Paracoccus sulfuroxidans]TWI29763.1 hypothetical protein IQ24_03580 [Paracoccus sulfuroxidans]TWI32723.1 hypothetical protein IQ24_02598 [Paracoccus sulfuroxidans]TWI38356.1 hypothetical protein IQ24_00496 [Paracoccus sulfuroxidans]
MTTASTATPKHVSGTIRTLEWVRADLSCWGENASAGLIKYNLTWTYRDDPEVWFRVIRYPDCKVIYEGGNEDAAYAAAQADYEDRILAAIQADPEPQPVACKTCSDFGLHEHALQPCRDCTQSSAGTVSVEAAARVKIALNEIRELNMTATDGDRHRWANSDLIDQTVTEGLVALRALAGERG